MTVPWFDAVVSQMLEAYAPLVLFLFLSATLGCALIILSYCCGPKRPDTEKLSSYECGFSPFGDARMKFDVRFYLVAILFIIFDLEVAFLFPWALRLQSLGWAGFASVTLFLTTLTIGFIYEWRKGALEWE